MQGVIGSILTAALLYGVYTETGIWTALSLFLVALYAEADRWLRQKKRFKRKPDSEFLKIIKKNRII